MQISLWRDGPPDADDPEQLITKRQLAVRIRKSVRWVEMEIHNGLPAEAVGQGWRFHWPTVKLWLKAEGRRRGRDSEGHF